MREDKLKIRRAVAVTPGRPKAPTPAVTMIGGHGDGREGGKVGRRFECCRDVKASPGRRRTPTPPPRGGGGVRGQIHVLKANANLLPPPLHKVRKPTEKVWAAVAVGYRRYAR